MKAYVYRYFWFTAGLFINSMGIALITKAALGTSPISSLPYVLSLRFPLSFGQFTFIINMFFILGQILLLQVSDIRRPDRRASDRGPSGARSG